MKTLAFLAILIVDVQWFGAVPDDGLDDTAAIQAAINAAKPNATVQMPPGDYQLSATVRIRTPGLRIDGQRARLVETEHLTPMVRIEANRCEINNLIFAGLDNADNYDGDDTKAAVMITGSFSAVSKCEISGKTCGVSILGAAHPRVESVVFIGFLVAPETPDVRLHQGVRCIDATAVIDGCVFHRWGNGIVIGSTSKYCAISRNRIFASLNNGVYGSSMAYGVISENIIGGALGVAGGIKVRGYSNTITANLVNDIPDGIGVVITGTETEHGLSNVVLANTITNCGVEGIRIDGATSPGKTTATIVGNAIRGSELPIQVIRGAEATVLGNRFD